MHLISPASIEITQIPDGANGDPYRVAEIKGRVRGQRLGQRVVVYAKSDQWWIQPLADRPFTAIQSDSTWHCSTHLGTEYAAFLVDSAYMPDLATPVFPKSSAIHAAAIKKDPGFQIPAPKLLHFSGYDWMVRDRPSDRGGKMSPYSDRNAWTDTGGFLHLQITRVQKKWVSAEIRLKRSLGHGLYSFCVSDVTQMDPTAVMTLYTWDDVGQDQRHREIDVEVSRWGAESTKNAQYVVQPYYEPANVVRFKAPRGKLTFSFFWQNGTVLFETARGCLNSPHPQVISSHTFTSGVPMPGGESVQINLYAFGNAPVAMKSSTEVVIEKFQYLP